MNQVWLSFAILHILMDIVCLLIHMCGAQYTAETQPHNVIFCGTFSGYMIFGIVRVTLLIIGQRTLLRVELVVEVTRMTMHFICALLAMHYAEEDFHLEYMGPQQELDHVFFGYCKMQGIACIAAGALGLLQSVLMLDMLLKSLPHEDLMPLETNMPPPVWDTTFDEMTIEQLDNMSRTNANIYFLGRQIDHWLCVRFKWFRQLALRQQLRFKTGEYTSTEAYTSDRSTALQRSLDTFSEFSTTSRTPTSTPSLLSVPVDVDDESDVRR